MNIFLSFRKEKCDITYCYDHYNPFQFPTLKILKCLEVKRNAEKRNILNSTLTHRARAFLALDLFKNKIKIKIVNCMASNY